MKNYQYLTDGLLESYTLGVLSEANREEAKQLIATDSELAFELEELELGMEQYFMQHAVPPPPAIKSALQQRLVGTELQKWEERYTSESPKPEPEPNRQAYVDVEVSDTHIRVHKYWRAAFIAVFMLSKIFLAFAMYQYFKSSSLEQEIERLKATQQVTSPMPRGQVR